MDILKSSRHSKITGDFGENLVLYFLSKYGFECARVDHTGIDLIARNPGTGELMGISVKSRSRKAGTEHESVTIPAGDFSKAQQASEAFGCMPYFAVVVDAGGRIRAFLMSMSHLLEVCPIRQRGAYWKVSPGYLTRHLADPEIGIFEFKTTNIQWWNRDLA